MLYIGSGLGGLGITEAGIPLYALAFSKTALMLVGLVEVMGSCVGAERMSNFFVLAGQSPPVEP